MKFVEVAQGNEGSIFLNLDLVTHAVQNSDGSVRVFFADGGESVSLYLSQWQTVRPELGLHR